MVSREIGEDVSFLLYFVPIVASIVYGIYEWSAVAHSGNSMSGLAFLIVSKSPYLYLISIISVCAALVIDVSSAPPSQRDSLLGVNASRMQILSVVVLIVTLAAAISAGSYNLVNGLSVFIAGRYALIFAFSLVAISILLVPKQILGTARASSYAEILGLILIAAAPVVLYLGIKAHLSFGVSAIAAIAIGIIGIYLYMNSSKLFAKKPEKTIVVQNTQKQGSSQPAAK